MRSVETAALDILKSAHGEPVASSTIRETIATQRGADPDELKGSVGAALSTLRSKRRTSGVIRVGSGTYAWRPNSLDDDVDPSSNVGRSRPGIAGPLIEIVSQIPGRDLKTQEIADLLQREHPELSRKSIGQALSSTSKKDARLVRVDYGVYRWVPDETSSVPTRAATKSAANALHRSDDLDEVAANVPDDLFEKVGLTIVGRSKSGARVATDEQGTVWTIEIEIRGAML